MNISDIISTIPNTSKPQNKFLSHFLPISCFFSGKANIKNLCRYGKISTRTAYRQIQKNFNFGHLNYKILENQGILEHKMIAAMDCSFLKKSGEHTENMGYFYDANQGKTVKGLEISGLALIDLDQNTAYTLDTRLSPGIQLKRERIAEIKTAHLERTRASKELGDYQEIEVTSIRKNIYIHKKCSQCHRMIAYKTCDFCEKNETKIDFFLMQLKAHILILKKVTNHLVVDGFYAKQKFINGSIDLGLDVITKLRSDCNLKYLAEASDTKILRRGAPKKYDGKFTISDLSRFEKINHQGFNLYSKVMYSPQFQRTLKIVIVQNQDKYHSILCSTDLTLSAQEIFRSYSARFQIEYLFRDGKSHLGLGDAQVRKEAALNFQNNACLTALNLLKIEHRKHEMEQEVISIFSYKQHRYNQFLIDSVLSNLGRNPKFYKNQNWYIALKNLGAISA